MITKKAIILLQQASCDNQQLEENLINCCKDNNLPVIEIIRIQDICDTKIFNKIINIINEQEKPISIIIQDYLYMSFSHIMICSVVGTLTMTGLAEIYLYMENPTNKKLELHLIKENKSNFLQIAELHFMQLFDLAGRELMKDNH